MKPEKNKSFSISLCEKVVIKLERHFFPSHTSLEEPFDQYGSGLTKINVILKLLSFGSPLPNSLS